METGPAPFLGALYEMGAQEVAFDVPQHQTEMIVLLNRQGLESTLPDMSAGVVMFLIVETFHSGVGPAEKRNG